MSENKPVLLPYGTITRQISVPDGNLAGIFDLEYVRPEDNLTNSINIALENPIGTSRLSNMAKVGDKIAIVVNDNTRATPNEALVNSLLQVLRKSGIRKEDITIIIALGVHRPNTEEEILKSLGEEICKNYRIINHDAVNTDKNIQVGVTPAGVPVELNKEFCCADLKILTGGIMPHHAAGFSGGAKSVMPGIASNRALKKHHSFPIRPRNSNMGRVQENQFQHESMAAAKVAGVDFILNVVQNRDNEVVGVFSGDLEKAWLSGVDLARKVFEVAVPQQLDIVITSPGGHPKDVNLHQSQKAIAAAELIIKNKGTIILVAACPDGVGNPTMEEWFRTAAGPQQVLERFEREGFNLASGKAYLLARGIVNSEIVVVTDNITDDKLHNLCLKPASSGQDALDQALKKHGKTAKVGILPNASSMVPVTKNYYSK